MYTRSDTYQSAIADTLIYQIKFSDTKTIEMKKCFQQTEKNISNGNFIMYSGNCLKFD